MSKKTNNKEQKVSVRQLADRYQANCNRIGEIADTCENEQRERTDEETAEYNGLLRENQLLVMRMQAAINVGQPSNAAPHSTTAQLREALTEAMEGGSRNGIVLALTREIQGTEALAGTGIIPVNEQEMLKPLRAGLIYDKVGITIRTGRYPALAQARQSRSQMGRRKRKADRKRDRLGQDHRNAQAFGRSDPRNPPGAFRQRRHRRKCY